MFLTLIIFLLLLLVQISLAAYSLLLSRKIDSKYEYYLGSQIDAATVLENYVKIYREVNVRVNADIAPPAYAFEEYIYINRDKMYNFDLFTAFFTIFQLELSRKSNNFARKLNIRQNFLLLTSIVLVILAQIILPTSISLYAMYIAIAIQVLLFFLSNIGVASYEKILNHSVEISKDLLDLDEVEIARAEKLKDDLKYHVFEYPLVVMGRFVKIFLPI